jgi:hypothetical protein
MILVITYSINFIRVIIRGEAIAVKSEIKDNTGWQLLELICRANIK